jgi:phage shock protein A
MALITRLSRLLRADLHAVLDRIEEPDVLLRQAVREMEAAVAEDHRRQRHLRHELRQLGEREAVIQRALDELEEQLDLCFGAGQAELAKAMVRRKLEKQRLKTLVDGRCQSLQHSLSVLEQRIEEQADRLEETRQQAALLDREERQRAEDRVATEVDFSIRAEDVEVAYLRERQRREQS